MEAVAEHEHESAHTIEHTVHGVAQGKGIVEDWLYAEDSSSDDESTEDPAGRGNRLAASYVRYEDDEDAAGTHGGIGATVYDHYGSAAHGADGDEEQPWHEGGSGSGDDDAWSSDGGDDEDWETPQSSQWGTWLSLTSSTLQDTITRGDFTAHDDGEYHEEGEEEYADEGGDEFDDGEGGEDDEGGFRMDSDSDDEGAHGAHQEEHDEDEHHFTEDGELLDSSEHDGGYGEGCEGGQEADALEYSADSNEQKLSEEEHEQKEDGEYGEAQHTYDAAAYEEGGQEVAEEEEEQEEEEEDLRESGTVGATPTGEEGEEGGGDERRGHKRRRKVVVQVRKRKPTAAAAFAERLLERHEGMRCVVFQGEAAGASDAVRASLMFLNTHAEEGWAVSGVRASRGSKQQRNLARRQQQAGTKGFEGGSTVPEEGGDEGASTPQSSRSSRGKARKNRRRLQVQVRLFRYSQWGGPATGEPPLLTPDTLSAQLLGVRLADAMRQAMGVEAEHLALTVPPADAAVPRTVEGPFEIVGASAAEGVKGGFANIHTLHVRTKRPNETDAEFGTYMRKCVEGVWKVAGRVHAAVSLARQSTTGTAVLEGTELPPYGAVLISGHGKSIATALSVATQAVGASRDAALAMQAATTSSGYGGGAAWEAPPGDGDDHNGDDLGAAAPSLKGVKGPSRISKRRAKAHGARAGWAKPVRGASKAAAGTGRPRGKLPPLSLADIAVGWAQPYKAPPGDAPAALGTAFDRQGGTMTASRTGLLGEPSALDGTGRITPATLLVTSGAGTSGSRTRELAIRSAAENIPSEVASVPAVTVTLFVLSSLF